MKKNVKSRFELSTDETAQIRFLHAEKSRVTRARLVSRDVTMKRVQKYYSVQDIAVGTRSRMGRSTPPAAQCEELKDVARF